MAWLETALLCWDFHSCQMLETPAGLANTFWIRWSISSLAAFSRTQVCPSCRGHSLPASPSRQWHPLKASAHIDNSRSKATREDIKGRIREGPPCTYQALGKTDKVMSLSRYLKRGHLRLSDVSKYNAQKYLKSPGRAEEEVDDL